MTSNEERRTTLSPGQVEPIRQAVTVRCAPERAFTLFTEGIGTWWPLDGYSRAVNEFEPGSVSAKELRFEPRLGGSIVEYLSDGQALPWAEVTVWRPPQEVVMAWRPHSLPEPPTELAAMFTALEDSTTLVELEHRGWDRVSRTFRDELYDVYVRGWVTTLGLFAAVADGETA
jgi:hypothetical protein